MATSDVIKMMRNPLFHSARQADFFSLVLAECAIYGVPPDALALFRDLHAMLGFSEPLGAKQIAALAGPAVVWRTHPSQPSFERIVELERLAFQQRALTAFGGGRDGEMIGRAEIVMAMGNIIQGSAPPEYYDVFQWASLDTLATLTGKPREQVLADKKEDGWRDIPDAEVIKPGGRLYDTYQTICTYIRREAIAALEKNPVHHPRHYLRPFAARFLHGSEQVRKEAEHEGLTEVVKVIDRQAEILNRMFPGLKSMDEEVDARNDAIERVLEDARAGNLDDYT